MPTKVFISHDDWNIKTPFISYSDNKFLRELRKTDMIPIVIYFEKKAKIRHRIKNSIYNYFVNIRKKKVEKQRLLEKRDKNTLWSSLMKCLGL
jgi:hypothetical protein